MNFDQVKGTSKSPNVQLVEAYKRRMGMGHPLPRSESELIAATGRNALGETVTQGKNNEQ